MNDEKLGHTIPIVQHAEIVSELHYDLASRINRLEWLVILQILVMAALFFVFMVSLMSR